MKLVKMTMIGSMLLVPTLAMGIAQQDPAAPQQPAAQQLQQNQATQPGATHEMTGEIVEIRDDSFSLRADDHTMWFTFTPENKAAWSAELVTGNRVTVTGTPGDAPDRMVATSIVRADSASASAQVPSRDTTADLDRDTDIDADVDVDSDSVTAEFDADREFETDTEIAQNELRTDDDAFDTDDDAFDTDDDRDELPRTASSLPALGSLGLLALLGAVAVAIARRF